MLAQGLIHRFEVKRINQELKRREEDLKKLQARSSETQEGGVLGQVGNWWSSLWGKPPSNLASPTTRPKADTQPKKPIDLEGKGSPCDSQTTPSDGSNSLEEEKKAPTSQEGTQTPSIQGAGKNSESEDEGARKLDIGPAIYLRVWAITLFTTNWLP